MTAVPAAAGGRPPRGMVKRALAEGPTGSGCGEAVITNAAA
jgi:hypothetical protein